MTLQRAPAARPRSAGAFLCKSTTLETRRVGGDQIEVFKIAHGIGLDSGMFFLIEDRQQNARS